MHDIVHDLYAKAGLIRDSHSRRYKLCVHSIRKYFRTQLAALGVPTDYIEYMLGQTTSVYQDTMMKGIEWLRSLYAAAGLSIKPRTKLGKLDMLKEIIRAWGLNPE